MNATSASAPESPNPTQLGFNSKASWLLPAAVIYTLFPIYGSLIPFVWQALPWNDAVAQFMALLAGPLSPHSRADFAANILLSIPLATLWQAALVGGAAPGGRPAQRISAALVWSACTTLALILEFSQIFFSGRQPALSDCVAQSVGAALGILLWRLTPPSWWQGSGTARVRWKQLNALYIAGMVLYAVMPLDLTVSLSELAHKFSAGMVRWVPFAGFFDHPVVALTDAVLDICIWAVAAVLAQRAAGRATASVLIGLWLLAVGIECAQFLVLSRVVDTTDIITAALGIVLGAKLSSTPSSAMQPQPPEEGIANISWIIRALLPLGLFTLGMVLRAYPFEFLTEPAVLRQRLAHLSVVPFSSYTANTELALVTNLLRRFFLFFAIGASVQWTLLASRWPRAWHTLLVSLCCAVAALAMTVLQIWLPAGFFDLGDVLLAALCGVIAAPVARRLLATPVDRSVATRGEVAVAYATASGDHQGRATRASRSKRQRANLAAAISQVSSARLRAVALLGSLALPLVLTALAYLPATPYNVRELLTSGGWPWPVLPITLSLLGMFGAATVIVPLASGSGQRVRKAGRTTACLLMVPLMLAVLLYLGVDTESVHDVVGSPVWGMWSAGEVLLRLSALLLGVVWSFSLGVALAGALVPSSLRVVSSTRLLIHGVWVIPLWHVTVVVFAGTDNLTELMAGGGSVLTSLCILAYGVLVGWITGEGVRVMASHLTRHLAKWVCMLAISAVLGYGLAFLATESILIKYDKVFSALQFLLSTDRNHYVSAPALVLRFGLVHVATVLAAFVSIWTVEWWARLLRSKIQHSRATLAPVRGEGLGLHRAAAERSSPGTR
jgi:VanZ family protein